MACTGAPRMVFLLAVAIGIIAIGCKPRPRSPLEDLPDLASLVPASTRTPRRPERVPETVSISRIVVNYIGVHQPGVTPRWTWQQARLRAEHLARVARSKGWDFAALAKRFSDDAASGSAGGDLGVVCRGELHPDLEAVAFSLGVGQVADPIHTPDGFVILQRHEPTEAQAAEILVSYTGAKRYAPREPRTPDEAAALARAVWERLRSGASFEAQARAHSDLPSHARGGFVPIFRRGTQHPKFEEIVWSLPVGGLSEIVETPTGFHLVSRWPVRRIRGRLMTIPFASDKAPRRVEGLLQRDAARELADRVRHELERPGVDFAALPADPRFSGHVETNGRIERFGRAEVPVPLEQVAFELPIGQVSRVVEIEGAFCVFKRLP